MNRGRQPKHRFKCASHVAQLFSARLLSLWTGLCGRKLSTEKALPVSCSRSRARLSGRPAMLYPSRQWSFAQGASKMGVQELDTFMSGGFLMLQLPTAADPARHNSPIPTENVFRCAARTRHCVGSRPIARGIGHQGNDVLARSASATQDDRFSAVCVWQHPTQNNAANSPADEKSTDVNNGFEGHSGSS